MQNEGMHEGHGLNGCGQEGNPGLDLERPNRVGLDQFAEYHCIDFDEMLRVRSVAHKCRLGFLEVVSEVSELFLVRPRQGPYHEVDVRVLRLEIALDPRHKGLSIRHPRVECHSQPKRFLLDLGPEQK